MMRILRWFLFFSLSFLVLLNFQNCAVPQPSSQEVQPSENTPLTIDDIFIQASASGVLDYGSDVTLQVLNPKAGYSYHWYSDADYTFNGIDSPNLVIKNVTPEKMVNYYVVVNGTTSSNKISFQVKYPRS